MPYYSMYGSSPTWGMWIEMMTGARWVSRAVDRSSPTWGMWIEMPLTTSRQNFSIGHPPHGGCGLKSQPPQANMRICKSSPTWGMWIEMMEVVFDAPQDRVIPHMGDVD